MLSATYLSAINFMNRQMNLLLNGQPQRGAKAGSPIDYLLSLGHEGGTVRLGADFAVTNSGGVEVSAVAHVREVFVEQPFAPAIIEFYTRHVGAPVPIPADIKMFCGYNDNVGVPTYSNDVAIGGLLTRGSGDIVIAMPTTDAIWFVGVKVPTVTTFTGRIEIRQ